MPQKSLANSARFFRDLKVMLHLSSFPDPFTGHRCQVDPNGLQCQRADQYCTGIEGPPSVDARTGQPALGRALFAPFE